MNKLLESVDSFGIPLIEKKFYHVTSKKWDGGDLRPLGDEDEFAKRWPEAGNLGQVHAHVVHMYDNKKDALRDHSVYGGDILEIDPEGLDWEIDDLEFPHPVARIVPASAIRVVKESLDFGSSLEEDFKTSAKRFIDQGAEQAEVDQYFTQFKSLKQRIQEPEKKDIDRWSSWEEFKAFVDELKGTKSKSQLKKAGQEHIGQDVPGATLVAEDPYWWVYKIDTYEASRKIGSKTKWCIVADENHWAGYTVDGSKFFFYISKRLKPSVKWYKIAAQVQDGDITYWDAEDQSHKGGDRSIPFKIPAIPQSELEKIQDDDKLITVYLNKDISDEDFEVLEQELHTQLDYRGGFELAVGSESVNIHLKNPKVFKGKEREAGELVYAIKVTLKDMGYGVEEIAWSVPWRY